jgi:Na+/phosphate symporter
MVGPVLMLAMLVAALFTWMCRSSIAIVLLVASFGASRVAGPTGAFAGAGLTSAEALPALLDTQHTGRKASPARQCLDALH